MITLRIMLSTLGMVLMTATVTAQTRFNNDPGVSVHNYKHPHKAKQAARIEAAQSGTLPATGQTATQQDMRQTPRNYKAFSPSEQVNDVLLALPGREVEYTPNPLMAKDNYKRQHRPASGKKTSAPAQPDEELAQDENRHNAVRD